MTNFKYDNPNTNKIENYLNYILYLFKCNPNLYDTKDDSTVNIIYNSLNTLNLKSSDLDEYNQGLDIGEFFPKWIENFSTTNNIRAFQAKEWEYFLQFTNYTTGVNNSKYEYIKLYIPIDSTHLYESVNELFKFMADNDIHHESKVAKNIRNDNVVIRLRGEDFENAKKIIDWINENNYIKEGLNKPNPFVPCISGIGIMQENGISYNHEIAKCIDLFTKKHLSDDKVTLEEFISDLENLTNNNEVLEVFYSLLNIDKKIKLTDTQKQSLLIEGMLETYKKYNYNQVYNALLEVIKHNNYNAFTSGRTNLRGRIKENLTPDDIKKYMTQAIKNFKEHDGLDPNDEHYDELLTHCYCDIELGNKQMLEFDEACKVTLENYDKKWLLDALRMLIYEGSSRGFSRYSKDDIDHKLNYREMIGKISKFQSSRILKISLKSKGIDLADKNMDEMINTYANILNDSIYDDLDKSTSR